MHVAVAIVGFRNVGDVRRCLAALESSTWTDFEVIICENGGPAAYEVLIGALAPTLAGGQKVRVVLAAGNLGYGGGVNVCLRETPAADAWWVLNPDTEPHREAMGLLANRLARGDCEAAGCTIYLPDGRVQSHGGRWNRWLARASSIGHGDPIANTPDPASIEARQNYLNGAAILVGRRFCEIAGPMREDYFLYCEEVEWCLRAGAGGARLGFASGALVLHCQGGATGNVTEIRDKARLPVYLSERNRLLLTHDRFPGRVPFVALAVLANLMLRYPRRGAWRQFGYGLAGWCAGLAMRRGKPTWAGP